MTPRARTSLTNLAVLLGAMAGVVAATAPLTRAMARDVVIAHGESTFVRRDTFALYIQRVANGRLVDSILHAEERRADLLRWEKTSADIDTLKRCLRRPSRCLNN